VVDRWPDVPAGRILLLILRTPAGSLAPAPVRAIIPQGQAQSLRLRVGIPRLVEPPELGLGMVIRRPGVVPSPDPALAIP
jgi:hypothetical protein